MFLKSKVYRAALAGLLVLSMFTLTLADTIRLKDGSIIKGRIISFGDGKFTVLIGEGARQRQMNFFADEVESIEFEQIPPAALNTGKTTLPTGGGTVGPVAQNEPRTTPVPTPTPTPNRNVIITDRTTMPVPTPTPTPTPVSTPVPTPTPAVRTDPTPKAVTLSVKVLADSTANGWTNSGWVVKKGQKIRITGKGQVSLGNGRFASASGIASLPDKDKLVQQEPTGGLIAVIGDDNNEFIFIGASREFVAARDGALFLGINEGNLEDNSGAFDVTIEIVPN